MKKFAFLLLFTAVVTYGQTPAPPKPKSDAEKIASAMGAGPKFVTQSATVLDWPSSPGGDFRVLRPGTNGWTCLPGFPQAAHDEPAPLSASPGSGGKSKPTSNSAAFLLFRPALPLLTISITPTRARAEVIVCANW
jgi:hypothetical protein